MSLYLQIEKGCQDTENSAVFIVNKYSQQTSDDRKLCLL